MKVLDAFANVLRSMRLDADMTQAELAALAGLHPNFISRLELASAQPTLETLFALGRALGCPPQLLVEKTFEGGTTYRRGPRPKITTGAVKRKPGRPPKAPAAH
ncbi:helix-turn-helix domain-containing protein [Pseudorhodoferax soli]|uniref:helix-turn-helix domain-containing protein n=1 Tax=Pseudorhodoferax soli TaxID=545864 RepID=UPI000DF3BABD